MALYLGSEKLGVTIARGANCATGTVTADDTGTVTFPELSFVPKMIAIWNVTQRDLKAEYEAGGEYWEEGYVQYIHTGIMLFAIYQDDTWVSQGIDGNSSGSYISNETWVAGSTVDFNSENNCYSYRIERKRQTQEYTGEIFNYAIYG